MSAIHIPYPPSANRLWRAVNGRNIKSAEYRAWLTEAGWKVTVQHPDKVHGPYRMTLTATRPDNRRRDLGNLEKPVSDLLVECGVIADDCQAQSILLQWAPTPATSPGSVVVTLVEV